MYQPEIGVSTAALYPTHLTEDALTAAGELGFPVAEVFLQTREEYTLTFGKTLDERRRACGMRVHSMHMHNDFFELWSPYPRMLVEARERFMRTLEIAALLEAQALTWHGIRFGFKNPAFVARFLEGATWAAEQARAVGVTLCLENVSWCYLRTPEQIRTLEEHNVPVGFTFDSFQAGESSIDPTTLIHAMNSRLKTVHLADYDPAGPRHLPLGEGLLDWPGILRALDTIGYRGPLIIELAGVESVDTLRASRTFIEQQIACYNNRA